MDGKNKNVVQEISSAASVWPKYPIAANSVRSSAGAGASANHFSFMSPSKLPISPTSFNYVGQKPYFMNGFGFSAGASSSGTQPPSFPGFNPFSLRSEKNKAFQNLFPPPAEKLNIGPFPNTAVGNVFQGRGDRYREQTMDQKKLRRVISNRLSAQRSRIRKLQHVTDMEKKVESLQNLVAVLSSQVQMEKDKQTFLRNEQKHLQNRLLACANHRIMVDAEIEKKRAEVNRLRELNLRQQMRAQNMAVWEHGLPSVQMPINPCLNNSGTGQPLYVSSDQVDGEVDYIAEEMNRLNLLNLQQEDPRHMMLPLPGWEAGGGDFTNVGLDQSGPEPFPNQPQQEQFGSFNSGFGELEKIFNFNTRKQ